MGNIADTETGKGKEEYLERATGRIVENAIGEEVYLVIKQLLLSHNVQDTMQHVENKNMNRTWLLLLSDKEYLVEGVANIENVIKYNNGE